jgi:hypothetical protein
LALRVFVVLVGVVARFRRGSKVLRSPMSALTRVFVLTHKEIAAARPIDITHNGFAATLRAAVFARRRLGCVTIENGVNQLIVGDNVKQLEQQTANRHFASNRFAAEAVG